MKKFIIGFGSFLKNDYIMYNVFKWIMLNFNKLFHIFIIALNIWIYTVNGYGCDSAWYFTLLAILNILLTIMIFFSLLHHCVERDNEDAWIFKTWRYKIYFIDIEFKN